MYEHEVTSSPPRRSVALLALFGLVLASCGANGESDSAAGATQTAPPADVQTEDEADHTDDEADDTEAEADHTEEFEFGEPMDAADATRVIEIKATDKLTFDPASVVITAGETVTFRVENVGALPHDFTLGDAHLQEAHDEEMAEMAAMGDSEMAMHDEPNAFSLDPGETKEMTWHFTEPGEILMGCHVVGHYAAGMKGTITIEA